MPPGLCFAFTVTVGCRGVSPKKLRTLLPQRDCFRFARNSPHGCAIRNGLGHKSQAGRKSKSLRCPGDAGEGSFCPAVAARASLVREGRTALLFFAARAIPVAGGGWRTLGLVRALGYADHMSTHSRSFPAPRRGALHEEQAPQEADREEKKRSAPRRRSGGKASPEQGADRQGPSRRSGRRVSGEPAAQAPARAKTGRGKKAEQPEHAAGEAHALPRWRQERREQRREARQQEQVLLARRWPDLPRSALPKEDFSVQVAARDYMQPLLEELGDRVITVRGRLVLARGTEPAAWAQNVWTEPRWIPITSIGSGARQLSALQRNWRAHIPTLGGHVRRLRLMQEQLPYVAARPLHFGTPAPSAPLGAFTLWEKDLMLASPRTTSPFADGEVQFVENREDPPGRAYLKLWEVFTLTGRTPAPGELCIDLGAAPGGWTWVLGRLGCRVFSVDKAELAPQVAAMPGVNHCLGSGFGLEPRHVGQVDWLFSDMICYPDRLLETVQEWLAADACRNVVCTLKFQAQTDHETARAFAAIPGGRLLHLSCNKHELTFVKLAD